jgi:methylase of polypeptide subunit release factors
MAEAYPEATVHAVDDHGESIVVAREQAETAGVADCVDFEMATTGRTAGPTTTW